MPVRRAPPPSPTEPPPPNPEVRRPGQQSEYTLSPPRRPILDETQGLRTRRRTDAQDAPDELPARAPLRRLRSRSLLRLQRRPRADARDRHRLGRLPVL